MALLNIKGIDRVGLVNEVTQLLSNNLKVNIQSINISSLDGVFDGLITLVINDINNLNKVISKINKINGITSVTRKFKSS
jgi:GTP pyrophosphokinase